MIENVTIQIAKILYMTCGKRLEWLTFIDLLEPVVPGKYKHTKH